jgi:hypothetical protein
MKDPISFLLTLDTVVSYALPTVRIEIGRIILSLTLLYIYTLLSPAISSVAPDGPILHRRLPR